jgi:ubiquinone/menaquinone biosynthesis C-methylase UbiE
MSLGNFHNLAQPYQEGRRGFDSRIFEFLSEKVGRLKNKKILDVGSGTGIATRQLKEYGADVVGTDLAEGMISKAKENNNGIIYIVAPTSKLPLEDKTFDMVTAFSAFHWFCDKDSVGEIKRVLKNAGIFAVVNKNDVAGIRVDVDRYFEKYNIRHAKDDYDPAKILKNSGFRNVSKFTVVTTEKYTLDEALIYLQSISLWNSVSKDDKPDLLQKIKEFCEDTLKSKEVLERQIETTIVVGFNENHHSLGVI